MTTLRKLAMLATAGLVAAALMACGDDDSGSSSGNNNPETSVPEGSTTDGPNPGDGGTDSPVDLSSFPKYVQSIILTKTTENGTPDLEAVWGTIPDDDKFVFPATFFP